MSQLDWGELLATAHFSALHLEMRDTYSVGDERGPFDHWLATGEADTDPESPMWSGWTRTVRDTISRGVIMRRARVVSEPVTDYIRYEHAGTGVNLAAGELVRWLPRSRASDLCLPGNDFWLLDDHTVVFNLFNGAGDWGNPANEIRKEAAVVKLCTTAFESVWERATDHEEYRIR